MISEFINTSKGYIMPKNECTLTDQERRAINEFLAENWQQFLRAANDYLTPTEINDLESKLSA